MDNDYKVSKKLAIEEYLRSHLMYTVKELLDLTITETKVSAKGENTIYVAIDNIDDIMEIHIRMSECRNPELNTRNFIPPGFYERFMELNRRCTAAQTQTK